MADPRTEAEAQFNALRKYEAMRTRELSELFRPLVAVTDSYAELACRVVVVVGKHPPQAQWDVACRDLAADVFDFLIEWRRILLVGRPHVAYPLARRAYESLSLMNACFLNPTVADQWIAGKEIHNAAIRKELGKVEGVAPEKDTKELYRFFSSASHPNRDAIPERYLGSHNEFVLGSIGVPDLLITTDHAIHLLQMWFWNTALLGYAYRQALDTVDASFGKHYLLVAAEAERVSDWLTGEFNRLLAQARDIAASDL